VAGKTTVKISLTSKKADLRFPRCEVPKLLYVVQLSAESHTKKRFRPSLSRLISILTAETQIKRTPHFGKAKKKGQTSPKQKKGNPLIHEIGSA